MESKNFMSLFLVVVTILSVFFASAYADDTTICVSTGAPCGLNHLPNLCCDTSCSNFWSFSGGVCL
ncbi:hypothetical protein MKW92_014867 [Papaver armeniacum]|nr:hypothetical protein MKW92_021558 [Papaver armeniacum]KAI3900592.1 hypothetical protein MKW92_014867 [Papaver armeniacum]